MNMDKASRDKIYIYDRTTCTGSVDRFMRLIPRGIIQIRRPSSIYHIPHVSIDLVHTTRTVHNNSIREQYESIRSIVYKVTKESI